MDDLKPMLRLEKIEVVYKKVITAVQGISVDVYPGQLVVLLGTNGAGKTTIMRAISGFLGGDDARVTDGRILFEGEKIQNLQPQVIALRGIALVPEREKIYETLSVMENLVASSNNNANRVTRQRMIDTVFDHFPRLASVKSRLAGYLSGGERQMLAVGSALLCSPRLLLVDEMSLGLAPRLVEDLLGHLVELKKSLGLTIILVEQSAHLALPIADFGYVIESGRVVLDGDAKRLAEHKDIQEFYLGKGGGEGRKSYREVKQYRRSRRWYG